jgi:Zn finger protein HypA/HybF involved in hydrogenase expression
MNEKEKYNKGVCQCRNCGHVFHNSVIRHTEKKNYGVKRTDCCCPECGGVSFGLMDQIYIKSDTWLYADAKNTGDIDKWRKIL